MTRALVPWSVDEGRKKEILAYAIVNGNIAGLSNLGEFYQCPWGEVKEAPTEHLTDADLKCFELAIGIAVELNKEDSITNLKSFLITLLSSAEFDEALAKIIWDYFGEVGPEFKGVPPLHEELWKENVETDLSSQHKIRNILKIRSPVLNEKSPLTLYNRCFVEIILKEADYENLVIELTDCELRVGDMELIKKKIEEYGYYKNATDGSVVSVMIGRKEPPAKPQELQGVTRKRGHQDEGGNDTEDLVPISKSPSSSTNRSLSGSVLAARQYGGIQP